MAIRVAHAAGLPLRIAAKVAVDLVKLGRYAWNPQTNELQWDDTLKAMWGLPAGAPVDYDLWRACVHPDDLALVEAEIQRCTDPRGDGVYDIEYRVIGKTDGVERWIATRGQTNFEDHVPVSLHGVALDAPTAKISNERSSAALKRERTNWKRSTDGCALRSSNGSSPKPKSSSCNGWTRSGRLRPV